MSKPAPTTVMPIAPAVEPLPVRACQPGRARPEWEFGLQEGRTYTILIVDSVETNRRVLRAMLKQGPYRFVEAHRPSEASRLLESEPVDLVVLDLMLPEIGGAAFCRYIKADRRTRLVPVLMMTSVHGVENEVRGIESGADEFLAKPLHPEVVRARVRTLLRNKTATDSLEEAECILFSLAQAVELRDRYTAGHCERLARYSVAMGRAMGLPDTDLLALHRGGFLHDIGKISIPDEVLFGTGALSDSQWHVMKMHTVIGEQMCQPMKSLAPVLPIIRSHHEKWDGSGYPDGLCGEEISVLARILQVADVYDALTTARSYKPAVSHDQAISILRGEVQKGWRDPELVTLFADLSNSTSSGVVPWMEDAGMRSDAKEPGRATASSLQNLQLHLVSRQAGD